MTAAGRAPRRRWVMRARDLLSGERHVTAQVDPATGTIGFSAAGGPTLVLDPGDAHRLRQLLGHALDQLLVERGATPAPPHKETAAGLRRLADEVGAGRGPRDGDGMTKVPGARVPVVPVAVHDALCGVRRATPMRTVPPTMCCAGCGLGYLVESALSRGTRRATGARA